MIAIGRPFAQARSLISLENRKLLAATALVGAATLLVKLFALGREVVTANHLGTSDAKDASLTAWLIPGFLALIIPNAIVASLVPALIDTRLKQGAAEARRLFSEVILVSATMLLIVPAALLLAGPQLLALVAPGYGPAKLVLAYELMTILAPAVPLMGIAVVWSGPLNSDDRFLVAALAPGLVPLASTAGLMMSPSHGVHALAAGFTIGAALYFAVTGWAVYRSGLGSRPAWHGGLAPSRRVAGQFWPLVVNGAVFGGLGVVDQAMAATLGGGAVSTLGYGSMLVLPIIGIGSSALATTIFPHFSRQVAHENWVGMRTTLRTYSLVILCATAPIAIVMIVGARPIVSLFFERGEFSSEDTIAVARVQAMYALVIPVQALATLMSRLVIALGATHVMLMGSIAIFGLNVAGDYLLKEWIGVEGIALATVLNQIVSLVFLVFILRWAIAKRLVAR
jgi:putative peptidoglycan lipid II flippase